MKLIDKIKDIIFKVKDYDRLESDYCTVLDMVTGARLSTQRESVEMQGQPPQLREGELSHARHSEKQPDKTDYQL